MERRNTIKWLLFGPLFLTALPVLGRNRIYEQAYRFKTSLNAYSFNTWLRTKKMTVDQLLEFCSEVGFDAIDLTGYYLPDYPTPPDDTYIYHIKKKAHRLGLAISGTGISNDFTNPDAHVRAESLVRIKQWVEVAAKLGAPVLRVFAGHSDYSGHERAEVLQWVVQGFRACARYGARHGVIIAMQNHNAFVKTPKQSKEIIELVNSDWFGLVLDIGSYREGDLYANIEEMIPYAVNWQIKELVYHNGKEGPIDLKRLVKIIKRSNYRGYLPIETFGNQNFKERVKNFLGQLQTELYK
ncbi:sugar phosphate isomerase/epimerase family protein [Maribacter sp. 2304DJ31-5]|uniref:sugar phosphate isomerase/epimerase family protein n=1 Tax=Maribacter sp. 2304DJ31-5 TaxID=3386273 RepID=UPI0039BC6228